MLRLQLRLPRRRLPYRRAGAALLVCAVLGACAAPPPKPAPSPALAAKSGPPDWDGAYYGTSTRFRATERDCPHPGILTLYVGQSSFDFRWNQIDIEAVIAPDGSVSGQGPGITLSGQVKGRRMEGDVTNGACGLHFTVTRRF